MRRAFLLVLDSLGVGGAVDAARFSDEGADTLGHLAAACARGDGDRDGLRRGPLTVPTLERLGLGAAAWRATGTWPAGLARRAPFEGAHGCMDEQSAGKDTPSGHWELAGLPVPRPWRTFPARAPSFPQALVDALVREGELPGILGNCAESGTEIVARLGAEHVATGRPILYTSGDSVLQIAAHEESFGLARLQALCRTARRLADAYGIGRVIARPFVGSAGAYRRTHHRRDYQTPPHGATLLDHVGAAGGRVIALGKIDDIFASRGVDEAVHAGGNDDVFDAMLASAGRAVDRTLVFANLVDFDTLYGHRRDVPGYAAALEHVDRRLPTLLERLVPGDLLALTADHGCDPTWRGTDHTRERVPVLLTGPGIPSLDLGVRPTFADLGQTLAAHLGTAPLLHGEALLPVE